MDTWLENEMKDILDTFENQEAFNTGVRGISGGFARAEYQEMFEDFFYFELRWGVQSDCQNSVNTEQYKIPVGIVANKNLDILTKVQMIESA